MDVDYDNTCSLLTSESMRQRADSLGVVWAKVGSYPFWPAQIISEAEVASRPDLLKSKRAKTAIVPVIFFGEYTTSWLPLSNVIPWGEGMRREAHKKSGSGLRLGVAEVANFLSLDSPAAPAVWWIAPGQGAVTLESFLVPPKPPKGTSANPQEDKDNSKPKKSAVGVLSANVQAPSAATTTAAAPGAVTESSRPPIDTLAVVNGKLVIPPRCRSGAGSRASGASFSAGLVNNSAVPDKNKPPNYVHLKQNVWVSRPRPKRLAKDEIAVCNCKALLPLVPAPPKANAAPGRCNSTVEEPAVEKQEQQLVSVVPALEVLLSTGPPPVQASNDEMELAEQDQDKLIVKQLVAAAISTAITRLEGSSSSGGQNNSPVTAPPQSLAAPVTVTVGAVVEPASNQPRIGRHAASASGNLDALEPPAAADGVTLGGQNDAPVTALLRDGCGDNCLNRLSYIHCDVRTCPSGERCANRPFYQLPSPPLEVFLTSDKGWGVRATSPITKGTFIAEYAGEIIDEVEVARRTEEYRRRNEPHFYMMEMAPGMVIDASAKGNIARLLNSSCDPNCEAQKWFDASTGEIRVGLFTLRDVAPGEELMYNYQFQHFGMASAAGDYICKCGAPRCKGTMVHKDKELARDLDRRIQVWWEGDGCFYQGKVIGYSALTNRHVILYDDGETEKISLATQKHEWLDGKGSSSPTKVVQSSAAAAVAVKVASPKKASKKSPKKVMTLNGKSPQSPTVPRVPRTKVTPMKVEPEGEQTPGAIVVPVGVVTADQQQPVEGLIPPANALSTEVKDFLQPLLPPGMNIDRIKLESLLQLLGGRLSDLVDGVGSLQSNTIEAATRTVSLDPVKVEVIGHLPIAVGAPIPEQSANLAERNTNLATADDDAVHSPQENGNNVGDNSPSPTIPVVAEHDPHPDVADQPMAVTIGPPPSCPTQRLLESLGLKLQGMQEEARVAHLAAVETGLVAMMKVYEKLTPPVDNPGAAAVSGHLHGNGKDGVGSRRPAPAPAPTPVPVTGDDELAGAAGRRKRARKSYGNDFVVEEVNPTNVQQTVKAATVAPSSERAHPVASNHDNKKSGEDRGVVTPAVTPSAAAVVAAAVAVAPPAHRIALGPTPASTGLPARTILVAKKLTHSDVSKGRILLPRAAVEANLSFAIGRAHSLSAKDHNGISWEFTLQSWANGMESRRVYVLEHAGDYIRHHVLKQEDVIGISCTPEGEFMVEYNTGEVRTAAETQQAARVNPTVVGPPLPPIARDSANPLIQHNYGRCTRSEFCNKPAGHPGFCMRSAGGAAAARGRGRGRGRASGRGRGRGGTKRPAPSPVVGGGGGGGGAVDPNRPKRSRRPSYKATSDLEEGEEEEEEGDEHYDEDEDEEEFDGEEDEDYADDGSEDGSEGEREGRPPPSHQHQHQHQRLVVSGAGRSSVSGGSMGPSRGRGMPMRHHAPLQGPQPLHPYLPRHGGRAVTPPRDSMPGVPPIFVMAGGEGGNAGMLPMPPHLRSPLRPHLTSQHTNSANAGSMGGRGPPSQTGGAATGLTRQPSISSPSNPEGGQQQAGALAAVKEDASNAAAATKITAEPEQPASKAAAEEGNDASPRRQQQQDNVVARAGLGVPAPVAAPSLPSPASLAIPQPVVPPTLPAVLGVGGGALGGASFSPSSFLPQRGQPIPPIPPLTVPLFGAAPPPTCPSAVPQHSQANATNEQQNNEFDVMSFLGQ